MNDMSLKAKIRNIASKKNISASAVGKFIKLVLIGNGPG